MGVKEEIAALVASGGTPREVANLKATRFGQAITGPITYTYNGIRYTISNIGVEDRNGVSMLRCTMAARIAPSGAWIITADDVVNPIFIINPPILTPAGTEDLLTSFKLMLERIVKERQNA